MNKFFNSIIIFLLSFLLCNVVNADSLLPTDVYPGYEHYTPTHYVVNNLNWYGSNSSSPTNKWAFQYNTTNYNSNLTYTISGSIYSSNSISNMYGTPLIEINGYFCQIQNTYQLEQVVDSGGDSFYTTRVSSISSFICSDVKITSSASEYLNILLSYSADYVRLTSISINPSNSSDAIKEQQETNKKLDEQIKKTEELNKNITNHDTSGAQSDADNLKNNPAFNDTSGLSSIISMPLNFINSLGTSCSSLELNIPYFETSITLPCMSTIYSKFGALYTLVYGVINGFVIYRILIELFYIVKNSKDPDIDKVEVMEL